MKPLSALRPSRPLREPSYQTWMTYASSTMKIAASSASVRLMLTEVLQVQAVGQLLDLLPLLG
jgi:hypothetical protein